MTAQPASAGNDPPDITGADHRPKARSRTAGPPALQLVPHDQGTELDPDQQAAVDADEGSVLILAGAGSGKTRVLCERAARLATGHGAGAVVVITFTNRAADELRGRLSRRIGTDAAAQMTIGTFHAVCHRLLRNHHTAIDRSSEFSVYDNAAARALLATTLKQQRLDRELDTALVASQIGKAKAHLVDPGGYLELARSRLAVAIGAAYGHYQEALAASDALDLDDLLIAAFELFGDNDMAERYRRRWRAVLVDEYQDTNPAQDAWLRRLAGPTPNVTVVGDPGQAVYGFRAADVGNILTFAERFRGTRQVALKRNYRSAGAIVDSARALASRMEGVVAMFTDAAAGAPVAVIGAADVAEEADEVARWARGLLDSDVPAEEIAVLFRTRAQAPPLEDALLLAGIACRLQGTHGLLDSAAVRDLVACLSLLANPHDRIALDRALGTQPGVGRVTIGRVVEASADTGVDPITACAQARRVAGLHGKIALAVEAFGRTLSGLADRGVGETAVAATTELGLADRLKAQRSERAEEQLSALRRFCLAARRYESQTDSPVLADFLAQAALASDDGGETKQVTLSTLHAAKGAEWDHVWLAGAAEGLLPHYRSLAEGSLDEERRLAYVGITRARRELTLSWPHARQGRQLPRSRFIAEAGLVNANPVTGRLAA